MKICIIGFSGSGKSTLAKRFAEFYNIKRLHLDSVHFLPNWCERSDSDMEGIVRDFISIELFSFIFNIADVLITFGVICFVIHIILDSIKDFKDKKDCKK